MGRLPVVAVDLFDKRRLAAADRNLMLAIAASQTAFRRCPFVSVPVLGVCSGRVRNEVTRCRTCWLNWKSCATMRKTASELESLATDPKKRELFERLAAHLKVLATEVERVMLQSRK
jgi:hypothetical protein